MADTERPQIYLITPAEIDLATFPDQLGRVLDNTEIACLRMAPASRDEDRIARIADALREVAHARDVALVIQEHGLMVERLGLDGVHLTDGARSVRKMRRALGREAIVGAYCGNTRHDGMNAGEAGADYVSFGPVGETALGDGMRADPELFAWWSEMIEVPVVAEGNLDEASVATLSPITDFLGFGDEVWSHEDPVARLRALIAAIG